MKDAPQNTDYLDRPDNTRLSHLPGDYGLPFLGCMIPLVNNPSALIGSYYERYGPVCRTQTTGQKMVWALGPDYNRDITVDSQQLFSAHMGYDGMLRDFFAGGLLMKDFGEHHFHRRIMQTAFKTESLKQHLVQINERVSRDLPTWSSRPDFHFYPTIKTLLLDIGAKVFIGLEMGNEAHRLNQAFLDMMEGVLSIIRRDWPGLLYRRAMNGRRSLERYFLELTPQKRTSTANDMMSHFARERDEDGQPYPDTVVRDHILFLLLAAHDTTTSALTMAAYYLARNPEWQERLRQEAVGTGGEAPEYNTIKGGLPLIEQTFHEILRLHPPVPQLMRRTVQDTELGGYEIPADTLVAISPSFTHRMKEYWREPDNFDPDRFGPERLEHKAHPYLWVPFGGGAHKCIGMHFADILFKCVMHDMLRRYRWTLPDGYPTNPAIMHFPFSKLKDNLPLRLEPLH
ncbi:cytochrome P450 [Denitratisoma oestradiolicum]|uniref:Cytochrome P450 n=1 Tax=Denitratisoma oestradiolicum TaxID=311182 RepID=A0A6S6YBH6_9PROT|nr:cytochrome P450 [Denitratisoma oestradiolicum]CAB1369976.1 Cytochrome P450 [Denitratisoma oestradiolicum]